MMNVRTFVPDDGNMLIVVNIGNTIAKYTFVFDHYCEKAKELRE